jgi:hypothetical protein
MVISLGSVAVTEFGHTNFGVCLACHLMRMVGFVVRNAPDASPGEPVWHCERSRASSDFVATSSGPTRVTQRPPRLLPRVSSSHLQTLLCRQSAVELPLPLPFRVDKHAEQESVVRNV